MSVHMLCVPPRLPQLAHLPRRLLRPLVALLPRLPRLPPLPLLALSVVTLGTPLARAEIHRCHVVKDGEVRVVFTDIHCPEGSLVAKALEPTIPQSNSTGADSTDRVTGHHAVGLSREEHRMLEKLDTRLQQRRLAQQKLKQRRASALRDQILADRRAAGKICRKARSELERIARARRRGYTLKEGLRLDARAEEMQQQLAVHC